jgi:opacity protein-like surface antigen
MPDSLCRILQGPAVTAAALLAVPVAQAQYYGDYGGSRGVAQWHIEGGFSDTSGTTSDYLQGGWLVDGGFSYFPEAGALGVRADISYSAYAGNGDYLGAGLEPGSAGFGHGYGAISSGAIGAVVRVPVTNRARFYALAQVGVAYVQLHSDRYYYGGGCDSYYGCDGYGYGDLYDTTRLGWNVGVGVEFPLYWGQSWFLEAQYRQVQAPTPIQYWPLMVGYRF